MALDAICLSAVVEELRSAISPGLMTWCWPCEEGMGMYGYFCLPIPVILDFT